MSDAGMTAMTAKMGARVVLRAAASTTRVDVAWTPVLGATGYQIDRRAAGGGFTQIGTSTTAGFSDTSATANSAYLYRVRAVNAAGASSSSTADLATTIVFIDSPLVPGMSVKSVHMTQLRTAIAAVRSLAGISSFAFTNSATSGTMIRALNLTEIRSSLDAARSALGLSTGGYTGTTLTSVAINATHLQEVRDRVR